MNYYLLALLKSPLEPLTYQSEEELSLGDVCEVQLKNRKNLLGAVVIQKCTQPDFKCTSIEKITDQYISSKQIQLAQFIAQYYVCSLGEALGLFVPFCKDIEWEDSKEQFHSNIALSSSQQKAYDFILQHKQALLFANTGSGKTEIYIKLIEQKLNENKQALLLMPEISLTPQMQIRLEKVFGKSIAIWHSKVSKKRKEEILNGLQNGSIKLIAGARSALFLPFSNLGIIVVDEEHDDSYKSDQKPRYNAKDLALYTSSKFDIQVVLGSATVSTGSFAKIPYYRLNETFYNSKVQFTYDPTSEHLSNLILNKINQKLQQNEQVIVFLPTRANYKYQICFDCGKAVQCPFCSVAMSLHKDKRALKCHYCNYMQKIPQNCPNCKTGIISNFRMGTAQVQEELQFHFPNKIIEKFDRDSIKTDKQLRQLLQNFNENKIDILVGTQMLSKGHDYHNVTLAVILGIDSVLNMESYKAREKTLSLLVQTAGRSGRSGMGEVIVQTSNAEFFDHYLSNSDYEGFLKDELEYRKELYPPYKRLAKVVFAHKNGILAKEQMEFYKEKLLKNFEKIELIGSGESAVFKIANKYRYEILIRSSSSVELLKFLHSIQSSIASIDMDTLA